MSHLFLDDYRAGDWIVWKTGVEHRVRRVVSRLYHGAEVVPPVLYTECGLRSRVVGEPKREGRRACVRCCRAEERTP